MFYETCDSHIDGTSPNMVVYVVTQFLPIATPLGQWRSTGVYTHWQNCSSWSQNASNDFSTRWHSKTRASDSAFCLKKDVPSRLVCKGSANNTWMLLKYEEKVFILWREEAVSGVGMSRGTRDEAEGGGGSREGGCIQLIGIEHKYCTLYQWIY